MLCYAVPCCVVLYYVMLCSATLCYTVLCLVVLCYVITRNQHTGCKDACITQRHTQITEYSLQAPPVFMFVCRPAEEQVSSSIYMLTASMFSCHRLPQPKDLANILSVAAG